MKESSLVIFSSLPAVGGHTTTTLKLCEILSPSFDRTQVLYKTMPGHGHSLAAEQQLLAAGVGVQRLGNPLTCVRRVGRPQTFLAVGMRHQSPLLAVLLRPRHSAYYHITHELSSQVLRQLTLYKRFFSSLIFLSPATYREFPSHDPQRRGLNWAVQPTEVAGGFRPRGLRREGPPRLGFLGRLNRSKGVQILLDLMARVRVPCELHIAGAGEMEPEIEQAAQRVGGEGRIFFHGAFSADRRNDFLNDFFARIDWLCVPTLDEREGLPNVILEALQAGVPVLASATGGMRSFAMTELGPAPDEVVQLVEPERMMAAIEARLLEPALDVSELCRGYFSNYFSDAVVRGHWRRILNLPA